ncbi:MAG TPA: glycosyltransferase family 4 protein [Planctomycetota bacterium]|nr:glycosyltransferase family 4 protein [Planctomycetota bacterium]
MPKVVLVGGPDVDARLELGQQLAGDYDVQVFGSSPALAPAFAGHGVAYHCYPLTRRANPIADLRTLLHLRSAFRSARADVVHAFDTKPGIWGAIAARWAGVPVVVGTVTGLGSLYVAEGLKARLMRSVYQRLQRLACRCSDLTVFQNHDDVRQLVAAGVVPQDRTRVILGSGVACDRYAQERVGAPERDRLRQELGIPAAATVVTMVGRVTRSKGVLEFMAAADAVRARAGPVRFLLVGPADEDVLDRLTPAELAALRRSVIWPGPRRDVPAVLAISDVFVLPSAYREGIPRVLLEAAAMGLPLVTTDSPGCNEVVVDGSNGALVAIGDVPALTRAIERLVEQPQLRRSWGAASRERAVTRFDLRIVAEQTRQVYAELLARKQLADQPRLPR